MTPRYTISLLGAGNVGTHLSRLLYEAGHEVLQVYDRKPEKAREAAFAANAQAIHTLEALKEAADLYLICVKDAAIAELAAALPHRGPLLCHTSGTMERAILGIGRRSGVFYPVQTFTKGIPLRFEDTALVIEAPEEADRTLLWNLALSLRGKPWILGQDARRQVHLAAVISNNFSNHLFRLAADWLQSEGLDFALLQPLLRETVQKLKYAPPGELQTGPAVRGDREIMERQMNMLQEAPTLQAIYRLFSESIDETKKH